MSKLPANSLRNRLLAAALLLTVVGFGTVIRSLYIVQIEKGDFYQQKAISQQLRTTTITANRGTIYDANMKKLAVSATVWTVVFSPADITDEQAEVLADGLADILGVDREMIIEKAKNKKNYHQIVKKKVEKETADKVLAFASQNKIGGVYLVEDSKRYYPYGTLASTVLGFVNDENQGSYGLEAYYNNTLSGTPGKMVSAKNAQGTDMPLEYTDMYDAQDGNSIVLTIDETVQHMVDKHVRTAVIEHGVKNRAAAIVMDVRTGEILAMTTMPDFDPNEPLVIANTATREAVNSMDRSTEEASQAYRKALEEAQFLQWNNKCISEPYEPGSVFKVFTVATALETGATDMNHTYNDPGYYVVGGVKKHCWKAGGHGHQTLAETVQNSCNPAFMMMGEAIGPLNFFNYYKNFGLASPTGVDLPGEANGINHSLEQLQKLSEGYLATTAFGQTIKVTPLQMITAVATAVNGGYLYEPHLVKQILDSEGNIVSTIEPNMKRQVISEETSKLVCQLLESVVNEGSGKNAYIPGYRIGGKTGTSEKLDLKRATGRDENILSFVGIAPMDDPQYAVLVLLDEPSLTNAYGSTIAAPVVGAIFADILPYLGVQKVYSESELKNAEVKVQNYVGKAPHDVQGNIARLNLTAKIMGSGGTVVSQMPPAGSEVPQGSTVILFTDANSASETVTVPDIVGKTGLAANKLILNAGLNIKVTGVGIENGNAVAAKQSIEAGTQVPRGTLVTVDFADISMQNIF
ncbi:MAG: penicillin-binding transpeptidase domain-containing protein [Angelakisella sp.]|nr:penicillin-binding transpeptidase domain-containing protein [Angelakisella sp.]